MDVSIPNKSGFLQPRGGIKADFRGMLTAEGGEALPRGVTINCGLRLGGNEGGEWRPGRLENL